MNKKIVSIILLTLLSLVFTSCSTDNNINKQEELSFSWDLESLEKEIKEANKPTNASKRLEELRKKIELKWLITRWDLYFSNKEYTTALTQYLQVYRKVPWDREVNLKIWDIYYRLWNYSRAYDFYSNIKDYPKLDKQKALYSYINSVDLTNSWSVQDVNNEIDSFWFDDQNNFYYKNSITCVNDFSLCRQKYQDYFDKIDEENKEIENKEDKKELNKNMQTIKDAFTNYYNFKIDDLTYKAALISWAYYKNWFYKIALETSKNILDENKWYKPVLKIAAKSAYELWNYIEARDFLIAYNKIETKDPEMSYFTWRVYEKLNEYVLSVIHFSKAINIWYNDVEDIKRRLIFIYFEIDDREKMLKTFRELIDSKSENLDIRDYNLAIYYHIINSDLDNAEKISEEAKQRYPESELFYWYQSWIMLQNENLSRVQERIIDNNINKGLEINSDNPMLQMVDWIYKTKKWEYEEALKSFKKAKELDKNREYIKTIDYWIDKTIKNINNNKEENDNRTKS